jgi:hypothetical protein
MNAIIRIKTNQISDNTLRILSFDCISNKIITIMIETGGTKSKIKLNKALVDTLLLIVIDIIFSPPVLIYID